MMQTLKKPSHFLIKRASIALLSFSLFSLTATATTAEVNDAKLSEAIKLSCDNYTGKNRERCRCELSVSFSHFSEKIKDFVLLGIQLKDKNPQLTPEFLSQVMSTNYDEDGAIVRELIEMNSITGKEISEQCIK